MYLNDRPGGYGFGHTVFPMGTTKDNQGQICGGVQNSTKTQITFPFLPVTGHVKAGVPSAGDFVPSNVSGVRYVSPGYK